MVRTAAAMWLLALASPAPAARPDAIAREARGTVTITASVAGQARLTGDGTAVCLWSNSATRLLDVTVPGADGGARPLALGGSIVAAATPGCAADTAARTRLIVAAARAAGASSILVSPE